MSYRCKLFFGDPPRLVTIGRVYAAFLTIHTVPFQGDFARVVVEEVRQADAKVPMRTLEDRIVGKALDTFIVWPTYLLRAISRGLRYFVIISLYVI